MKINCVCAALFFTAGWGTAAITIGRTWFSFFVWLKSSHTHTRWKIPVEKTRARFPSFLRFDRCAWFRIKIIKQTKGFSRCHTHTKCTRIYFTHAGNARQKGRTRRFSIMNMNDDDDDGVLFFDKCARCCAALRVVVRWETKKMCRQKVAAAARCRCAAQRIVRSAALHWPKRVRVRDWKNSKVN